LEDYPGKSFDKSPEGLIRSLEAAYRDSEKKYRELVDFIPLGIFEYDLEAHITYSNPRGMEMMGYTKEDLERKKVNISELVIPADHEKMKKRVRQLMKGKRLDGAEYTAIRKNGNTFPILLYSYPIAENEKITGIRGVVFDLTKSRLIEKQLHDVLTRYEVMLKSLPDLIFRFDKEGRFIDYHSSSSEKLMLKPEEFLGKLISEVDLPEVVRKQGMQKVKETLEKGRIIIDEYSLEGENGTEYYEARYIPISKDEVLDVIRDITDRVKAEMALRESEKKFRDLYENIPLGMFRTTPGGEMLLANPSLLNMLGVKNLEEIQAKGFPDLCREISYDRSAFISEIEKNGVVKGFESSIVLPGGNILHIRENARRIDDGSGNVYYEGSVEDITAIRDAHSIIKQIEAEKAVVLDSMNEMFAYFSPDLRIKWVNKAYADKLGVDQSELIGSKCYEHWHGLSQPCNNCPVIKAARTGLPQSGEVSTPDGRYWYARGYPVFDDKGQLVGLSEFCEDITMRKQAVESLRLTQFSVDQSSDAAFWIEENGNFIYVNEAACRVLGYAREELLGMTVHDVDPNFPREVWADHWKQIRTEKQVNIESVHRTGDGREFPVELMINFIEFDGREYNCVFARDITDRKQYEENLRRAKDKAEEANRVKSDFISNISHEIRIPLNSIIGFSEMLANQLQEPRLREYASSIKSAGNSLLMLINDILDLSKIEAGRVEVSLESVDLRAVINEISQVFAPKVAKKRLDFFIDVQSGIPTFLMLDKVRIRQVLFNLIGNAVKFTDQGFIRVLAETRSQGVLPGGKIDLLITIEDSGIGIPHKYHDKIFNAFVQIGASGNQSLEGTGLGLSITRRLLEMMSGSIMVDSEPGKGARFVVSLQDVQIAEYESQKILEQEVAGASFRGRHILLVDDSAINRHYVRDNLLESGMTVSEADNGEKALQEAGKKKPDLILMDIMMPVMDGYKAVEMIRQDKSLAGIPVLALTALAMKEDIERITSSGFNDYLIKPFNIHDLYAKMGRFLPAGKRGKHAVSSRSLLDQRNEETFISSVVAALDIIEKEHMPLWRHANEIKEFKSIRVFADGIQKTGVTHNIRLLVDYGDKLMAYCDNYDIERIDASLAGFPEYVEKMKEILNEPH
jgi:PAS domain S-box-containing protein